MRQVDWVSNFWKPKVQTLRGANWGKRSLGCAVASIIVYIINCFPIFPNVYIPLRICGLFTHQFVLVFAFSFVVFASSWFMWKKKLPAQVGPCLAQLIPCVMASVGMGQFPCFPSRPNTCCQLKTWFSDVFCQGTSCQNFTFCFRRVSTHESRPRHVEKGFCVVLHGMAWWNYPTGVGMCFNIVFIVMCLPFPALRGFWLVLNFKWILDVCKVTSAAVCPAASKLNLASEEQGV